MENNEKNNKKAIITLVIGIGVLLVLIFSATFAYFSVTSRNNFGTKTITGTAEATYARIDAPGTPGYFTAKNS